MWILGCEWIVYPMPCRWEVYVYVYPYLPLLEVLNPIQVYNRCYMVTVKRWKNKNKNKNETATMRLGCLLVLIPISRDWQLGSDRTSRTAAK